MDIGQHMHSTAAVPCYMCGLSATDDDPNYLGFNYVCVVIVLPMLAFLGMIGNSLSIYVFTRSEIRRNASSAVNDFLTVLAVSDNLILLTAVFMFTFENLRHSNETVRAIFLAAVQYVYPMAMLFQTLSIYITVTAAICCFLEVYSFVRLRGRRGAITNQNGSFRQIEPAASRQTTSAGPNTCACRCCR